MVETLQAIHKFLVIMLENLYARVLSSLPDDLTFIHKSESKSRWGEGLSPNLSFNCLLYVFFFGKLTYVLKKEDTNIIRGIPQIYNDNRNIKQQMATG
jgi:hypothetical protein